MTELSKIELDGTEEDASFDASELGAMMREMRQAMQRDLKDVAQELRIRRPYLEAIEDGRLDDLPGPAYTTGFLRAYSDYLGLDGEDIVNRFKQAGIDIDRRTNLILPSPLEEGRLPTGSVLLFAALFAVVAYAGWYYVSAGDQISVDQVASIPTEYESLTTVSQSEIGDLTIGDLAPGGAAVPIEETVPTGEDTQIASAEPSATSDSGPAQPTATPAPEPAEKVVSAATTETTEPQPTDSRPEVAAASDQPVTEPRPAAVVPPAPEAPSATPDEPSAGEAEVVAARAEPDREPTDIAPAVRADNLANAKIVIRATDDSWVEVRVGRKKPLLSRLMRAGETFEVASRPGLKMVTGNAGGVAIEVNGTPVPPLGAAGEILQNVSIDAKALLDRVPAQP